MQALLILAATALITGPALAFAEPSPADNPPGAVQSANTPDEAQKLPAGKFVQDLGNQAIAQVANPNISEDQKKRKYQDLLRSSFDMQAIAHFVAGRAWNNAPEEQRQEYLKLFEQMVVETYGDKLDLYSGESFRVKSVRPESEKDMIVSSEITHPDGSRPAKVDWRVRKLDADKLAIVDVVVEGVSQSITQREEYSSIIHRDGGKLDGLIKLMRKRVNQPG
ncbi:MAG: phospholipid-binding protein MlaC [Bdellovibrionales bacterium]